jgi:hypothetical protein
MRNRAHKVKGQHKAKKIPKSHQKHYWPYIPVLLMVIATFALSIFQPIIERGVLAYATEMSVNQLLAATNEQRVANGSEPLTVNLKLNSAAQSKADDMIARNYWSHNTPDGKEPWIFFDAAGYKYFKAGENLAYGFSTSNATVSGWMNSPSHKANLLDPDFTEVGFGFKNGTDYNDSGPETVVVAEYGRPQVLASGSSAPTPQASQPEAVPEKISAAPTLKPIEAPDLASSLEKKKKLILNSSSGDVAVAPSVPITRLESISGSQPWLVFAVGMLSGLAAAILLLKHAVMLKHAFVSTERFVLKHPVLDAALVGMILIGTFLMQSSAYIQ